MCSSSATCLFTIRIGDKRSGLQKHFPFPLHFLSALIYPLSISAFLCLKGFCERPKMKGCPQWERDCRDSAAGTRCYQNCSLRIAPPGKDAHRHCPKFVHVQQQKDVPLNSLLLKKIYPSSVQTTCALCHMERM